MKYFKLLKPLFIYLFIFSFLTIYAADEKRNVLEEEIGFLNSKIDVLSKKTRTLGEEIEFLERKAEVVAKEKELALSRKKEMEQIIKDLQHFIIDTKTKIKTKSDYLKVRLRELYKKENYLMLEILLFPESEESMIHSTNMFTFTSKKDNEALKNLMELKKMKEKAEFDYHLNKKELEEKLIQITENQKKNRKITKEKKAFFKRISSQKKMYTEMLDERNQLLQELIESIGLERNKSMPAAIPITKFKGLLSYPLRGKIIENFGKVRNKKFGTYLKNNGVKIRAQKGSSVKSFYDGIVVYSDWYKSYGKLVIVDHGDGYFSFYGHLDSFSVKINQMVLKGDKIGLSGDTGSLKGDVLHFEIWHKKTPLNPKNWVRKRR